jgi:hypothetical protein
MIAVHDTRINLLKQREMHLDRHLMVFYAFLTLSQNTKCQTSLDIEDPSGGLCVLIPTLV